MVILNIKQGAMMAVKMRYWHVLYLIRISFYLRHPVSTVRIFRSAFENISLHLSMLSQQIPIPYQLEGLDNFHLSKCNEWENDAK